MKCIVLFLNLFFTERCAFNNNGIFEYISSVNNNQYITDYKIKKKKINKYFLFMRFLFFSKFPRTNLCKGIF